MNRLGKELVSKATSENTKSVLTRQRPHLPRHHPHKREIERRLHVRIRIITVNKNRDSCRDLFKNLNILPFHLQYTLSFLLFVVDNKSIYNLNSEIHNINMRQKFSFNQHSANLSP
jgi:hypothetical protein